MDIIIETCLFQLVTILIYVIFLNRIFVSLASFDRYFGSFTVYRVVFLVDSGAVQVHGTWLQLFSAILLNRNFARKNFFFIYSINSCPMTNVQ